MSDRRDGKNRWEQENRRRLQDVGELPPVADPARKNRGLDSLEYFGLTYFPNRFFLPPSPAHREAVGELERATNDGGQVAIGMPRAFGKTSWAEVAVLRSALYGLRRFTLLVAATEKHAARSLKRIQGELETNELLLADFPEAIIPVRHLERNPLKARQQVYRGVPTRLEWTSEAVVLADIPGAACAGAALMTTGVTSALRGLQLLSPDGQPIRPDLVLCDDCQTRESARSPTQTSDREAIILDDVLMLAGPTTKISAVLLCTVIQAGDLSSRFLDPERHPEWRKVRTKTVVTMPANMDAWDNYGERRRLALTEDDEARVNADYLEHRAELDAGAVVSWEQRIKAGDVSALQSAMHVYLDNPRGFHAELQNDPQLPAAGTGTKELIPAEVAKRLSGSDRFIVPREATRLTAGFDCSPTNLHWFVLTAWGEQGGGVVVDYGPWPAQARAQFEANDARPSLATLYAGHTPAQRVFAGLRDLTAAVLGREYQREGGGTLRVEKALVDSGDETASVYKFVRQSPYAGVLYPSRGFARTITQRGVGEWRARPGERAGPCWRLTLGEVGQTRCIQFDTDHWKSTLHAALNVPAGGPTGLTLFGKRAGDHAMLAEHLGAEYGEPATVRGISFTKWMIRPHRPDNHLFDCLVLSAVAASVAGVKWEPTAPTPSGGPAPTSPAKKPIDFRELVMRNRALAAGRRR